MGFLLYIAISIETLKNIIMTTTQEFLNQLYKDIQEDYTDSIDREDTLVLLDELITSLNNLQ
tara:strand:+ start:1397 stop:1582 length:186 start_codon:yes stop_codon:yes gene_type:complete